MGVSKCSWGFFGFQQLWFLSGPRKDTNYYTSSTTSSCCFISAADRGNTELVAWNLDGGREVGREGEVERGREKIEEERGGEREGGRRQRSPSDDLWCSRYPWETGNSKSLSSAVIRFPLLKPTVSSSWGFLTGTRSTLTVSLALERSQKVVGAFPPIYTFHSGLGPD